MKDIDFSVAISTVDGIGLVHHFFTAFPTALCTLRTLIVLNTARISLHCGLLLRGRNETLTAVSNATCQ